MERQTKGLIIGIVMLCALLIIGIIITKPAPTPEYTFPPPDTVVRQYFMAWNDKNYPDMYATISDGFKKIEPQAKDLTTFRQYAGSQGIEKVSIVNIETTSNDGHTAAVEYAVVFTLTNGDSKQFRGTFTLKYRQGDVIQGWKLIHPYGEKIDEG